MFHKPRQWGMCLVLVASLCSGAMAQEEAAERPDARVEGFKLSESANDAAAPVKLEKPKSTATTWFILVGLGLLGIGVMFKGGNRSHLD